MKKLTASQKKQRQRETSLKGAAYGRGWHAGYDRAADLFKAESENWRRLNAYVNSDPPSAWEWLCGLSNPINADEHP